MQTEEKATIPEFIEQNDKLLAVLGIFIGAAAFTNNSQIRVIGQVVTFLFVLAALFIWSELFFRLRQSKPPHPRLVLFLLVLAATFLATVLYWMLEFNTILRYAAAGMLGEFLFIHLKQLEFFKGRRLLKVVLWMFVVSSSLILAGAFTRQLDRFRNYLISHQQPKPTTY